MSSGVPGLPVVCDRCGARWIDNSFMGESTVHGATLVGNKVGPCPRCGGVGSIVDGVYDLVDGAIKAFRTIDASTLENVQEVLRQAQSEQITPDQAADRIVVSAPELEILVREMQRQQQSWADPKWWVMALLAVLAIVVPLVQDHGGHLSDQDEQVIERAIRDAVVPPADAPSFTSEPPRAPSVRPTPERPQKAKAHPRKKRPPKTYGREKKRKR